MATRSKPVTGNAGEYYVAFLLSKLGYAVGLTARGTPHVDLLVAKPNGSKSLAIQVKTSENAYRSERAGCYWHWRVSEGAWESAPENLYWAFVDLREDKQDSTPNVYFLPSSDIQRSATQSPGWDRGWFWVDESDASKYRNSLQAVQKELE